MEFSDKFEKDLREGVRIDQELDTNPKRDNITQQQSTKRDPLGNFINRVLRQNVRRPNN